MGSLLLRIGVDGEALRTPTVDPHDALGRLVTEPVQSADMSTVPDHSVMDHGVALTGAAGADTLKGTQAGDGLTGLAAGLLHWITNAQSTVPTVGASGAIAGVLGAYFVLFPHARIIVLFPVLFLPFFFELPALTYLFVWFMTQVFGGTLAALGPQNVGGIAWWAHIGGFGAGMVLHRLFLLPQERAPRRRERDEYGPEWAWSRWD